MSEMKQYRVELAACRYVRATIEVAAPNTADAEKVALERAIEADWKSTTGGVDDLVVDTVEEVEPPRLHVVEPPQEPPAEDPIATWRESLNGQATTTVERILPKPYRRRGRVVEPEPYGDYSAEIPRDRRSIRIYGFEVRFQRSPRWFDRVFRVGQEVTYDSYNLTYTGTLRSIGPKTVTVEDGSTRRRLELHEFIWRNWDLDLEKVKHDNYVTGLSI